MEAGIRGWPLRSHQSLPQQLPLVCGVSCKNEPQTTTRHSLLRGYGVIRQLNGLTPVCWFIGPPSASAETSGSHHVHSPPRRGRHLSDAGAWCARRFRVGMPPQMIPTTSECVGLFFLRVESFSQRQDALGFLLKRARLHQPADRSGACQRCREGRSQYGPHRFPCGCYSGNQTLRSSGQYALLTGDDRCRSRHA